MLGAAPLIESGKLFKFGISAFDFFNQVLFAGFPLIFHHCVQFLKVFYFKVRNLAYVLGIVWVQDTLRAKKLSIQPADVRHLVVGMLLTLRSLNFIHSLLSLIERSPHNFIDFERFSTNQTVDSILNLAIVFHITA